MVFVELKIHWKSMHKSIHLAQIVGFAILLYDDWHYFLQVLANKLLLVEMVCKLGSLPKHKAWGIWQHLIRHFFYSRILLLLLSLLLATKSRCAASSRAFAMLETWLNGKCHTQLMWSLASGKKQGKLMSTSIHEIKPYHLEPVFSLLSVHSLIFCSIYFWS